ncbi:hypothetical protein [Actinomycetospora sp. TBRC 11914]|uniref:hypothetical protein n=1 Tax=Actinomycetospora sp. TBRC 11914 TaxID=2729387 RepID=UPI00145EE3CD|nr:hypothetical protein [Actinomycetospora sp. TBRC 11914]NMO93762.1 hypothetical protein [Actinomycetospora sp. TBRC 11914]
MRRPAGRPRRRPVRVAGDLERADRRRWEAALAAARAAERLSTDGDEELAVQLPPPFLESGALPRLVVGEELEVAPAIFVAAVTPAVPGASGWSIDEIGLVDAIGTVLTSLPGGADPASPVSVLDTGGRLFPLFWSGTAPVEGRTGIGGALYLDPDLAPGTEHGEVVALCRRRYRVTGLLRASRNGWAPSPPVEIPSVPDPPPADAVLVARLRPLGVRDTTAFPPLD